MQPICDPDKLEAAWLWFEKPWAVMCQRQDRSVGHLRKKIVRTLRRSLAASILAAGIAAVAPSPAQPHGPCRTSTTSVGCLAPRKGSPGTHVTILGTSVLRVVWNENVPYDSEAHYQPGASTIELLSLPGVERDVQFVVPKAAPGVYPVAIYDGQEGGGHYTWDLFRVTLPQDAGGTSTPLRSLKLWLPLAALGFLAVVLALMRHRIRLR